jgi:hypothetical protein
MWTLGGGVQYAGQNDGWFVALIGLAAVVAVLLALAGRSVGGRRRGRDRRSGYS